MARLFERIGDQWIKSTDVISIKAYRCEADRCFFTGTIDPDTDHHYMVTIYPGDGFVTYRAHHICHQATNPNLHWG